MSNRSVTGCATFTHHGDSFLRTLNSTDATTFAKYKINLVTLVDNSVRAVHGTHATCITGIPVNNRPENPPCPGIATGPFTRF